MNTSDRENASATRKKLIKPSSALPDCFDVPVCVVPISKLQFAEKNKWLHKLRMELHNVRAFQKRLDLLRAHSVTMSSSKDVLSHRNSQANTRKSLGPKKRTERRGQRASNRGGTGKFESKNEFTAKGTFSLVLRKQCDNLLKKLMLHQYGWMFDKPVDIVEFNIPDYYDVIKNPMDLGTIKEKLCSGSYSSPLDFLADVRLTFANAMIYNPPGNNVHVMADILGKFFEQKWKPIEKKLSVNGSQKHQVDDEINFANPMPQSNKRKFTQVEKRNPSTELEVHLDNLPDNIIGFLREHASNSNEAGEDEIEVDIDDLNDDAMLHLREMLNDHVQEKQNHTETKPSVIELLNESGVTNSTIQLHEGNDLAEEDVDICGNGTPVLNHHRIEIEKETNNTSEIQSRESISGLDQVEPNSTGSYIQNDDEDGIQNERLVSHEKLHRAAVLKNRFADTILKSQEKKLHQGENMDLEKLHREMDTIENQIRKEKARFQTEAKAVEDAQRRAKAEAAEEAKQMRDLERKAARQALLKMEKTVEINEASRFLEDLEILTVNPEQLPNPLEQLRLRDENNEGEEHSEVEAQRHGGVPYMKPEGQID